MTWNSQKNAVFFKRVRNVALAMQDTFDEIERLKLIYNAEGLSTGDPEYVDAEGLTVAELDAFFPVALDFQKFLTNQAVTTQDREALIAPIIVV